MRITTLITILALAGCSEKDAPGAVQPANLPLIRAVSLTGTEACRGQEILLHVETQSSEIEVRVDGRPGRDHVVRSLGVPDTAGLTNGHLRTLHIEATSPDGRSEQTTESVTFLPLDDPRCANLYFVRPVVHANPYEPYRVDVWAESGTSFNTARPALANRFTWSFSDGTVLQTTEPFVSHLLKAEVDHGSLRTALNVEVEATVLLDVANGEGVLVLGHEEFTIQSPHQRALQDGRVMLALDKTDVLMADLGTGLDLGFEVRNFSESTVKLTDFYLQTIPCDPDSPHVWDRVDASMVFGPELVPDEEAEDDPILIDPASAQNGLVTRTEAGVLGGGRLIRDSREISPEICWYGYHVAGLADGLPAVGSIYVQLQDNPVTRQTVDPTTAATLDGLKEHLERHGIDPEQEGIDINAVTSEDLYRLEQRGLLTRTINGWTLRGE